MRIVLLALLLAPLGTVGANAQTDPAAPPPGAMHNGDGAMRGAGPGGGMIGALMRADANGDGIVTREELIASADRMFDRLDANGDGIVTPEEMQASRGSMRRGGTPPSGDMGATPPPPPPSGATAPAGLTRQQWHDRALRQFDRVDANHDGKVDRTEIANFQEQRRERRQERRDGGGSMPPSAPAQQQPQA